MTLLVPAGTPWPLLPAAVLLPASDPGLRAARYGPRVPEPDRVVGRSHVPDARVPRGQAGSGAAYCARWARVDATSIMAGQRPLPGADRAGATE